MKIKTIFYFIPLILPAFVGCEKQEPIEYPAADTYTVSVDVSSIAGDIEVLFDGKPIGTEGRTSGKNITTSQPLTLLRSNGPRTLEMREAGSTTVIWDSIVNPADATHTSYNIKFYWNGEKITDELEMPSAAEGNIGILLQMEKGETLVEPMDIEVLYLYLGEDWMMHAGEPLDIVGDDNDIIEGYVPGSGFSSFIEVRTPNPANENYQMDEYLTFRLYKAGTKEPYSTLVTQRIYNYDVADECYIYNGISAWNPELAYTNTVMITISEHPGSYSLNENTPGKTGEVTYASSHVWGAPTNPAE